MIQYFTVIINNRVFKNIQVCIIKCHLHILNPISLILVCFRCVFLDAEIRHIN